MATPTTMTDLSVTAASNSPAGSESPTNGDDFLRAIQAIVRRTNAKGSDIASATTTDIGAATAEFVDVTGTTTITGLGTVDAGIVRTVRFTGALTLTHNATSLILPSGANITTAANDIAVFRSLGSGNWICVGYKKQDGTSVSAPYLPLAGGTVTGASTFSADVTMSGATMKWVKGADVASATALPLITDGNYFDVTGTTTITSFNSVGVGTWVALHFDGALTLTHHATDLILLGGANITTAAGDEALFIEYASGDYRCVNYTKANGTSVVGGVTVGATSAASGSNTIDITITSTAKIHTFLCNGLSLSGTDRPLVQLMDSGGAEATGYLANSAWIRTAATPDTQGSTAGLILNTKATAATVFSGRLTIEPIDSANNIWLMTFQGTETDANNYMMATATKTLSAALTGVRFTTTGTNTYDTTGAATITYIAQ